MDDTRVERWEQSVQVPMLVASGLFVAAYAWPILDPSMPARWALACQLVVWVTWAVLALDVLVRLGLSEDKWGFVKSHPIDLAAAILPILRPLQLLRLLTLLDSLNRHAGSSLRGHVGAYLAASISLVVLISSLSILDFERGGSGPIQTFGDALWWSLATITTVGYGDVYPVTTAGRFVAVGLMMCGIGVLGAVTGSFASWLVERVEEIEEDIEQGVTATADDVRALREELRAMREALEQRGAES